MQAAAWRVLVLVLLCGLSMGPLPELQLNFLGDRAAVTRLSLYLKAEGFDLDQFQALVGLLLGA